MQPSTRVHFQDYTESLNHTVKSTADLFSLRSSLCLKFVPLNHQHATPRLSSFSCLRCRGKSKIQHLSLPFAHVLYQILMHECGQADSIPPEAETTPAPATEPRDLISDINSFTSAIAVWPLSLKSMESFRLSEFSSGFANITSSAASASASLNLQLSTADAAASTSINSQLSQVAANVSNAASALKAAESAVNFTSTSTSATSSSSSSSTGGVACAQTAAAGMGALIGGMAALVQL